MFDDLGRRADEEHKGTRQLYGLPGDRMSVTAAVEDRRGITHVVVLAPNPVLAGCTVCNLRFWTARLGPPNPFFGGLARKMTDSQDPIDCMACLVGASTYDEAAAPGSE